MKQFKKECKHAQQEREHKSHYSEKERADGCWQCGGELGLEKRNKHYTKDNMFDVSCSFDPETRKLIESSPEEMQITLELLNRPSYICPVCWPKRIESW